MLESSKTTAVILCGGTGSRLSPMTDVVNKHVLAIYSKPMVYYPISIALQLGIRTITLVCNPGDIDIFSKILANLDYSSISIEFVIQSEPLGICDALLQASEKIYTKNSLVILGDNIFFGPQFIDAVQSAISSDDICRIFTYTVSKPKRFGVVERNLVGHIANIVEKPKTEVSKEAVTGMYYFEQEKLLKNLTSWKSAESKEMDVANLLKCYLKQNMLSDTKISSSNFWIDAGITEDLFIANEFVRSQEQSTGELIACLEEIAYKKGWLSRADLCDIISNQPGSPFRLYLQKILEK